ncbi:MAG: hypothetical protein JWO31_4267 [Phycisphaerales bacterium]|nr:hypothetical protein [Phycisphaerales bacterium]
MAILDVLMRYLHILSAVLAVGGAFFLAVLLPGSLRLIDDVARRDEVLLKVRRAYKMTVHPAILGLLVSGAYNTVRLWPTYKLNPARNHGLWGPHLLLGLLAIGISLWLLAGRTLRANHRTWLKANVGLMFVVILLASALRWVRLNTVAEAHAKETAGLRSQIDQLNAAAGAAAAPVSPTAIPAPLTAPAVPVVPTLVVPSTQPAGAP